MSATGGGGGEGVALRPDREPLQNPDGLRPCCDSISEFSTSTNFEVHVHCTGVCLLSSSEENNQVHLEKDRSRGVARSTDMGE